MTSIKELSKEAHEAAKWRGHKMTNFKKTNTPSMRVSECKICGMSMVINTKPTTNDCEIRGNAVALNCERKLTCQNSQ